MPSAEEKNPDSRLCSGTRPGSTADSASSHPESGNSRRACLRGRHGPGYQQYVYPKSHLPEKCPGEADTERKRTFLYQRNPARGAEPEAGRTDVRF